MLNRIIIFTKVKNIFNNRSVVVMITTSRNKFLGGKKNLVHEKLLSLIKEEKLKQGDKLPSERELS